MRNFILRLIGVAMLLSYSLCFNLRAEYHNDILGNGYLSRTIDQPDDYDGKVVCTIVKKEAQAKSKKAIIYVHGYNDYFFQVALGDSINAHGYNFYSVDLRKYGRSLLPHQDLYFCKKMDEYYADIDTTIAIAREEGNENIILLGHSTGGLSLALYLEDNQAQRKVDALILNSPFLDWNLSKTMENIITPCVSCLGAIFKRIKVQGASDCPSGYAQSLLKDFHGEWEYNTAWKTSEGHPKRSGWVRAIHRGHKKTQKGLNIQCPILLMSSDASAEETDDWNDIFLHTDIVLDVDEIQSFGAKLGKNVTPCIIKGGIHNLILSPKEARDNAYQSIFQWLDKIEN
ncbi:MAG: alpha/beta hydrolase [Paludibacteraceae bacterium]|nr:alpha/beta hydrolase [Paludibacteraceae bacterium]